MPALAWVWANSENKPQSNGGARLGHNRLRHNRGEGAVGNTQGLPGHQGIGSASLGTVAGVGSWVKDESSQNSRDWKRFPSRKQQEHRRWGVQNEVRWTRGGGSGFWGSLLPTPALYVLVSCE